MGIDDVRQSAAARLRRAGFLRPDDEAAALVARATTAGFVLDEILSRRERGEPLAWLLGATVFCGEVVRVDAGIYVPRAHTEALVHRALDLLPADGIAIDVCTGSGAVAAVLARRCPDATVLASDVDPRAVACARSNGVDAHVGDLFAPIPPTVAGRVDVVIGVVPYVPTAALALLQRDTLTFESPTAYDGGERGIAVLARAAAEATAWLRPGGHLLLELGGDEAEALAPLLSEHGYLGVDLLVDDEGDPRGIETTRP